MKHFKPWIIFVIAAMLFIPVKNANAYSSEITHDYDEYATSATLCNCVLFVRQLVPSFPSPATSIDQKKSHINSTIAAPGTVAIMTSSNYDENLKVYTGHVGFVESVDNDQITIIDSNFGSRQIRRRTGTEDELNIVGYFDPNHSSISFFEHTDCNGWEKSVLVSNDVCLYSDVGDGDPFPNDQLSCVEILKEGVTVILYEHSDLSGSKCIINGKGVHNLTDYGFNDLCSSFEITGN